MDISSEIKFKTVEHKLYRYEKNIDLPGFRIDIRATFYDVSNGQSNGQSHPDK